MLWPSPPWDAVTYWALDLETGGLDPRSDPILSVGMVPIRAGGIRLGEAWSSLVRPEDAALVGGYAGWVTDRTFLVGGGARTIDPAFLLHPQIIQAKRFNGSSRCPLLESLFCYADL